MEEITTPSRRVKSEVAGISAASVSAENVNVNMNIHSPTSLQDSKPLHLFPKPNPKFTGRTFKVEQIKAALKHCNGKTNWWERTVVLHGFGGMGKSELAKVIADKASQDYDYINWFDVETENSATSSFKKFAKILKLDCEPEVDCNNVYVTVQNRWKSGLFIFDNANVLESREDMFGIQKFLPETCKTNQPVILVTSRHGESYWGEDLYNIKVIDVEKLSSVESYDCLVSYLGIKKEEITKELEVAIVGLANQLDGYPLGLTNVGRLIAASVKKITLPGVQARIKDYTDVLAGKSFANLVGESKMTAQLDKILDWTIGKIMVEEEGPAALEVLAIVASMSSNDTSFVGLIRAIYLNEEFNKYSHFKDCRFEDLDVEFKTCLTLLVSYSLITIEEYKDWFGVPYDLVHMHRLVQNSCLFSHMDDINGSIAVEKIIQYFIQDYHGYSDTFEELFSFISSQNPVNINQCMAVLFCLNQINYRDSRKIFVALNNFRRKRNLDPDQQKMSNILQLFAVIRMLDNDVIKSRTLADILAQPHNVVFHTRKDYKKPRRDQQTIQGDSNSPVMIFQPKNYEAKQMLELTQYFYRIHPTENESSLSQLNLEITSVQNYQESIDENNIYFVVDPSDALQDVLSLSLNFRTQFWVVSSCISVLDKLTGMCEGFSRKPELLNWIKKLWSECEKTDRQRKIVSQIIDVVHFLGGEEALDTDFLSSVFRLSHEFARRHFWVLIYNRFENMDSLLKAVHVDVMSRSLYFSKPARQIDFFNQSDAYSKIIQKAAESAIVSQNLCRSGFCKGVADAISSMLNYCMSANCKWDRWEILITAFQWLEILWSLQKSNACSCATSLHDTLLNQFNSCNTWLQNRIESTEINVEEVTEIEQFRKYCATNNRNEWLDVASKYLSLLGRL